MGEPTTPEHIQVLIKAVETTAREATQAGEAWRIGRESGAPNVEALFDAYHAALNRDDQARIALNQAT